MTTIHYVAFPSYKQIFITNTKSSSLIFNVSRPGDSNEQLVYHLSSD